MRTVAAVVDQGALTFDLAIPCEVFGLDRSDIVDPLVRVPAGRRGQDAPCGHRRASLIDTPYRPRRISSGRTRSSCPGGPTRTRRPSPGSSRPRSSTAARARRAHRPQLCTGAFVLAHNRAARRTPRHYTLDVRRPATAHVFRSYDLDPHVLYTVDGRVMTSAGTAAGIDLCLHIVALDEGLEVAATVARRVVASRSSAPAARRSTWTKPIGRETGSPRD